MDSDQPIDDELAVYEDYGLDVMRIDGVPCAEWDGKWLPIDLGEEPPRPSGTMLVTATHDPGPGFMSNEAYFELMKVDASTLVSIARIDGAPTEISVRDFEPGTEAAEIDAFIDDMQGMFPDAYVEDDDDPDAEPPEGEPQLSFFHH